MKKTWKKSLAVILAALLIIPSLPMMSNKALATEVNAATNGNAVERQGMAEEVLFNTGNHAYSVVNEELIEEKGDAVFEQDGSYTINIPEANPFFPYEVQFTCDGVTVNKWFMTPEENVEVGGHTFKVSAYFDNETVTQLTLNVAGTEVIVYPEEKEFTNDESGGIMLLSLLPLKEKYLSVDLTGFTPIELTQVSIASLFKGEEKALDGVSKVVWTYGTDGHSYVNVDTPETFIDVRTSLLYNYINEPSTVLQLIVGDGDQLNSDNVRYVIEIQKSELENWMVPSVYTQDEEGNRTRLNVMDEHTYYRGGSLYFDNNGQSIYAYGDEKLEKAYVSFQVNKKLFPNPNYDHIKVYEGKYDTAQEAEKAADITNMFFADDMTQKDAGCLIIKKRSLGNGESGFGKYLGGKDVTMVTYDSAGKATGCLPIGVGLEITSWVSVTDISLDSPLYSNEKKEYVEAGRTYAGGQEAGCEGYYPSLFAEYPVNGLYVQRFSAYSNGMKDNSIVTAAYVGRYDTIAEAMADHAIDIKDKLFVERYADGYEADFSEGVFFSIFIGEDGEERQEVYHYHIYTEPSEVSRYDWHGFDTHQGSIWGVDEYVRFTGLKDDKDFVSNYAVSVMDDSYGEYNYHMILVEQDVDLTRLAPTFTFADWYIEERLYAEGGSGSEESGKSFHDFSRGAVQYTYTGGTTEDGTFSKNYWLTVLKAVEGQQLYISSFADEDAKTRTENGVIYSTREILLDALHDDHHDILIANIGTENIKNLSVELQSEVLQLDEYWTLNGKYDLAGFETVKTTTSYGTLSNLSKIRLVAKDGIEAGTDVEGTLTIKSAGKVLAVLTLTGTVGNPSIITKEIPEAVKYVPYGTMIQNSNKYSWNEVNYRLFKGSLPKGMEIRSNGEFYGVPKESGEFTFTIWMSNSHSEFLSSEATYTMVVKDNTDANVDGATDEGYELTGRIGDVDSDKNYVLVSKGAFTQFEALYLDGEKLVRGEDYKAESGSTRITIDGQTLTDAGSGTHTLGIEFRTPENELKRAAQNYGVEKSEASEKEEDNGDSNTENGNSPDDEEDTRDSESAVLGETVDEDTNLVYRVIHMVESPAAYLSDYNYNKADMFDISLISAATPFPITVVMTAPEGFDMSKTAILHLDSKNTVEEIFRNGNGYTYDAATNKVTFTVSHLSKFIFVELKDAAETVTAPVTEAAPYTSDAAMPYIWMLMLLSAGGVMYQCQQLARKRHK